MALTSQAFEPASGISAMTGSLSPHDISKLSLSLTPNIMISENISLADQSEHNRTQCRELNDSFRQTFIGGRVILTRDVRSLGDEIVREAIRLIQSFDQFTPDNDPHGEHDFGEVKVGHQRIWFKIDLYDKDLQYASPDPTDPKITTRVMIILLPEEY